MIGRIKNLDVKSRSGFIQDENGRAVYFGRSSVWEHDFQYLAVGQVVSFELQAVGRLSATNVHPFEGKYRPHFPEKPQGPLQLRYVGFSQANGLRTFQFQAVAEGEETRDYAVTADVGMFAKYHVGIQEGPALCKRLVLAELTAAHENCGPFKLVEKDILAHVAARAVAPRKPFRRRPPTVRHVRKS